MDISADFSSTAIRSTAMQNTGPGSLQYLEDVYVSDVDSVNRLTTPGGDRITTRVLIDSSLYDRVIF